jgi:hypothetical protein
MTKARKNSLNYGLIMGLVTVTLNVVLYVTGNYNLGSGEEANLWLSIFNIAVTVTFPLLAILKQKTDQGGFISFWEAFRSGFTVILVAAILVGAWLLVYTMALNPDYKEQLIEQTIAQMQASGQDLTEEQMDQGIAMTERFSTPWMMAGFTIVSSAFFGAIISAILGGILQKRSPESI